MQMALSRGANGFRGEAGGVDEPARATDVFYGLALLSVLSGPRGPVLVLARQRHRNAIRRGPLGPTIAITRPQKLGPRRRFDAPGSLEDAPFLFFQRR